MPTVLRGERSKRTESHPSVKCERVRVGRYGVDLTAQPECGSNQCSVFNEFVEKATNTSPLRGSTYHYLVDVAERLRDHRPEHQELLTIVRIVAAKRQRVAQDDSLLRRYDVAIRERSQAAELRAIEKSDIGLSAGVQREDLFIVSGYQRPNGERFRPSGRNTTHTLHGL